MIVGTDAPRSGLTIIKIFQFADQHSKTKDHFHSVAVGCLITKGRVLSFALALRFIYEDWSMPHTAAKLKFPYFWDEQCLQSHQKDEL